MTELAIDIVSDVVCPWCFIGKHRLEAALQLLREERPDIDQAYMAMAQVARRSGLMTFGDRSRARGPAAARAAPSATPSAR